MVKWVRSAELGGLERILLRELLWKIDFHHLPHQLIVKTTRTKLSSAFYY